MTEQRDLSGDRPPGRLGPPDRADYGAVDGVPRRLPAPAAEVPPTRAPGRSRRRCPVTAWRWRDRARVSAAQADRSVRQRLTSFLGATPGGGRRPGRRDRPAAGAEQLAAEAAVIVDVPYLVVLPFPEPDRDWPADQRDRFAALLAAAREVRRSTFGIPATSQAATAALRRRDVWLARHVSEALVVWDGVDERLRRLYGDLLRLPRRRRAVARPHRRAPGPMSEAADSRPAVARLRRRALDLGIDLEAGPAEGLVPLVERVEAALGAVDATVDCGRGALGGTVPRPAARGSGGVRRRRVPACRQRRRQRLGLASGARPTGVGPLPAGEQSATGVGAGRAPRRAGASA